VPNPPAKDQTTPAVPSSEDKAKKSVSQTAVAQAAPQPAAKAANQNSKVPVVADDTSPDFGPRFGTVQFSSGSQGISVKVKLAIAAAVLVLAGGAYLIWGGKSHTDTPLSPAATVDKAGPSIMVGGGGWIEGWAGDPEGTHFGRTITIYRPSLRLSDYRIEFQGQIETKSLGWVFRASDPNNYYAMKLAIVSGGASPQIALLKYLVASGRQTQVGRVPIDQTVHLDTLYSVRVDVRGPRFTTYVQGQQADIWTDDQLKSGGVGFLNEREERGRIKSVSVSLLNGAKP